MSTTTNSESTGNIIGSILKYGIENGLIIEKYINTNALENDTLTLLLNWKSNKPLSYLTTELCKMWFTAGYTVVSEVSGWQDFWNGYSSVKKILQKEGYFGLEDEY